MRLYSPFIELFLNPFSPLTVSLLFFFLFFLPSFLPFFLPPYLHSSFSQERSTTLLPASPPQSQSCSPSPLSFCSAKVSAPFFFPDLSVSPLDTSLSATSKLSAHLPLFVAVSSPHLCALWLFLFFSFRSKEDEGFLAKLPTFEKRCETPAGIFEMFMQEV